MEQHTIKQTIERRTLLASATAALGLLASPARAATSAPPEQAHLYHRDWGTGKPVVFVHGWALNSDMWQYQMLHMADHGYRAIAYDRRGHGRSSDPGRGYDYDTLAADLASFLQRLDLRDVVLVGHSMGAGEIARYLTRNGTGRVSKTLLLAPTMPFTMKTADNPHGLDKQTLDTLRADFCSDFPKWLAEAAGPFFGPGTSDATIRWGIQMCLQASLLALAECNRTGVETDFRAELRKIETKTLIIPFMETPTQARRWILRAAESPNSFQVRR